MRKVKKKIYSFINYLFNTFKIFTFFDKKTALLYFIKNIIYKRENGKGKKYHNLLYSRIKIVLANTFADVIDKHKKNDYKNVSTIGESKKIWLIWWQGLKECKYDSIQMNIELIKKNNPDWDVIIISKFNYLDYLTIDKKIVDLFNSGAISYTHISDYLRVALLRKYGGVYIDVNFYTEKSFEYLDKYVFCTLKHGLCSDYHICKGLWHTGFMCAGKENSLFVFVEDMYNNFFNKYNFIPSYLMIDCLISIGYDELPSIKKEIDNIPFNNKEYNFINIHGNEEYIENIWLEVSKNTFLFNANYKNAFNLKTKDLKDTYYSHLYGKKS